MPWRRGFKFSRRGSDEIDSACLEDCARSILLAKPTIASTSTCSLNEAIKGLVHNVLIETLPGIQPLIQATHSRSAASELQPLLWESGLDVLGLDVLGGDSLGNMEIRAVLNRKLPELLSDFNYSIDLPLPVNAIQVVQS